MKKHLNSNKITRQQKMLEVCEFLGIGLNTIYVYQNRNKKTPTGRINKLGYRLLMNADLDTLAFFLNDRNFTNDYFIADERVELPYVAVTLLVPSVVALFWLRVIVYVFAFHCAVRITFPYFPVTLVPLAYVFVPQL